MIRNVRKHVLVNRIVVLESALQERDAIIFALRKELAEIKAPKKKEALGNKIFEGK